MDLYDIKLESTNSDFLDKVLVAGQKVRITRMVTFEYDVDIADYVDVLGKTDVSVNEVIHLEMDENGVLDNPNIMRNAHNVDDEVIAVEVL